MIEDVQRYPASSLGDIHTRIGTEIPRRRLQGVLASLVTEKQVRMEGERRWARYSLGGADL